MLKRHFDPRKPYRVVVYLRMSSDQQNPRSPDQQLATIKDTIRRLGLPWQIVEVYTDAAVSGKYVNKRKEFMRMLHDIRSGKVKADLILVDTFDRFGRTDDVAMIRRQLYRHHGCLVLTADTQFADPTSTAGQVLAAFEGVRATEDNRVKAHMVVRGKRDTINLNHWPGGPVPFGYQLQSKLADRNGRTEVEYSVLVPNPATGWIITALFGRAFETGDGCTRLAQWLNAHPDIPDALKPFSDHTVNAWLASPIYKGEMVWEAYSTEVVDDCRVIEKNPADAVLRRPGFCEPLVPADRWDAVNEVRTARGARIRARRKDAAEAEKLIAPLVAGVALRYPMSGLVVCGDCGLALTASASPAYTSKAGETKRYVSYVCPRAASGACGNKVRVPEAWLWGAVVKLIRDRLFPCE